MTFAQTIILASTLVGSFYLNSLSVIEINKMFIKNENINYYFIIFNGLIFFSSGIIITLCCIETYLQLKSK